MSVRKGLRRVNANRNADSQATQKLGVCYGVWRRALELEAKMPDGRHATRRAVNRVKWLSWTELGGKMGKSHNQQLL